MKSPWSGNRRLLHIRRWALALIYYYRSILYYCWVRFVGNLTHPYLEKFLGTTFERMDRSPIENNPRPTLRGTSTCFRGSPGGSKVPTTYPPYPLFYSSALLSSSLRAVRTLTVCRGCCSLLGNLSPAGRKLLYYVPCWFFFWCGSTWLEWDRCCAGLVQGFVTRLVLCCAGRLEHVFLSSRKSRGIL